MRQLLGRTHVMGICLGHQLIARATGHETYKLPFGHRGANHPVHERLTGRVLVTSQNHGFAVAASEAAEVVARLALRRHGRGPRPARSCALARSSSIPRRGRGRTTPGRSLEAWVEEVRECLGAPTSSRSASSAPARS